jgi:hypothetical protein
MRHLFNETIDDLLTRELIRNGPSVDLFYLSGNGIHHVSKLISVPPNNVEEKIKALVEEGKAHFEPESMEPQEGSQLLDAEYAIRLTNLLAPDNVEAWYLLWWVYTLMDREEKGYCPLIDLQEKTSRARRRIRILDPELRLAPKVFREEAERRRKYAERRVSQL